MFSDDLDRKSQAHVGGVEQNHNGEVTLHDRRGWMVGLCLAAFQLVYFWPGYRMSADDIMFFQAAIRGWEQVLDLAWMLAVGQGRVGGFILVPLNAIGAYATEFRVLRAAILILDFSLMALIALWVARLARQSFAGTLFALMMGTYVLAFSHTSPSAFPLQNTVPYALLILLRLPGPGRRTSWLIIRAVLAAIAMATSEYALMFGVGLLVVEYLVNMQRDGFVVTTACRRIWIDALSAVIPFAVYVAWRLRHPSGYSGNQPVFTDMSVFLKTWYGHTLGLWNVPIEATEWGDRFGVVQGLIFAGLLVFALLRSDLQQVPRSVGRSLLVGGLILAFYMAMPASMTVQQQDWCRHASSCVFLDSRAAFYGVAVAMFGLLLLAYRRLLPRVLAILFIGQFAMEVSMGNLATAREMQKRADVWARAADLACFQGDIRADLIDPDQLVSIHPQLDDRHFLGRDGFWRIYIDYARQSCPATRVSR